MDLSNLDKKYFIDPHVYNCPFCKRGNVSYSIVSTFTVDWTEKKKCYAYIVRCESVGCDKHSLHLSFEEIIGRYIKAEGQIVFLFKEDIDIDKCIFYSRPSSFFTLDNRIPEPIRQLIFEAEQARQSNLLVGASACLRKAIYKLLEHEKSIIRNEKTGRANYAESIEGLKSKYPDVSPELFNALAHIQEMTSDLVHEGSWESWDSSKLRFLIELVKATLNETYVIPDERKSKLKLLSDLKSKLVQDKKTEGKELSIPNADERV